MNTHELYYTSCSTAARAVSNNDADMRLAYDAIYYQLNNGMMPGAIQPAPNSHWKVPVQGLRDMGYDPDLTKARPLNYVINAKGKAKIAAQQAPAEDVKQPTLQEENARLKAENTDLYAAWGKAEAELVEVRRELALADGSNNLLQQQLADLQEGLNLLAQAAATAPGTSAQRQELHDRYMSN